MAFTSTRRTVSGEGTARLQRRLGTALYTSFGTTTYTSTTVVEQKAATKAISTTATPDVVNFSVVHGMSVGQRIQIVGHSASVWNGEWQVVKIETTQQIRIGANQSTTGTGGTGRRVPDHRSLRAGMLVDAAVTTGGYHELTYGRISTFSDQTDSKTITVESWVLGTPTDGQTYTVAGFMIDLPRSQKLVQTFTPRQLVHELYRGRIEALWHGYEYTCEIGYDKYLSADDLYAMHDLLNLHEDDRLTLIPRLDMPGFQYNVIYDQALAMQLFGIAGGYQQFGLAFRGKNLVSFPVLDGYGSHYANTYGTYL